MINANKNVVTGEDGQKRHCALRPDNACRIFSATFEDFDFDPCPSGFELTANGCVMRAHSTLASMAKNSSGSGVVQATWGDQPSQPTATENIRST